MSSAPFIIYGLPRSRTYWLSKFLSYGDTICLAEPAIDLREVADIRRLLSPGRGAADSAAVHGWRLVRHHVPNIRAVVVRRPIEDVLQSFQRLQARGVATWDPRLLRGVLERGGRALDEVEATPDVLRVAYADLAHESVGRAIWEHCLPGAFDREWWARWDGTIVRADVGEVVQHYQRHMADILTFKARCKAEMRALVRAGHIQRRG